MPFSIVHYESGCGGGLELKSNFVYPYADRQSGSVSDRRRTGDPHAVHQAERAQAQCLAADKEKTNLICSVISNQIFVYDSFGSAIE